MSINYMNLITFKTEKKNQNTFLGCLYIFDSLKLLVLMINLASYFYIVCLIDSEKVIHLKASNEQLNFAHTVFNDKAIKPAFEGLKKMMLNFL